MSSSNVVRLPDRLGAARVEDYLGPAEVKRAAPGAVTVVLPDGREAPAGNALAFPYEPAEGDTLLVIGKGDAFWVIGVIRGAGRSVLSMPGDVDLHAGGALRLSAEKGVVIKAPEVEVYADKLRTIAGSVVERFTSVYKRVSELYSVHAGQSHTLVDDAMYTQSKSAAIVTEETVTINGSEIHIG
jgi:hypothetical protein